MKNFRVHPTHWLISTQGLARGRDHVALLDAEEVRAHDVEVGLRARDVRSRRRRDAPSKAARRTPARTSPKSLAMDAMNLTSWNVIASLSMDVNSVMTRPADARWT